MKWTTLLLAAFLALPVSMPTDAFAQQKTQGKIQTQARQCQAKTKEGTQCKRKARPGSQYCWQHDPKAPKKKDR